MNGSDICRILAPTLRREPELLPHRQEAGLNDSIVSPDGDDAGCAVRGRSRGTRVRHGHAARATRRTYDTGCKAEGTKFHDLNGERQARLGRARARRLAHLGRLRQRRRPRQRRAVRRHGLERRLRDHRHQADEQQQDAHVRAAKKYRLREQRPGGGTGGWTCTYPNASTSGGFANGTGGDFSAATARSTSPARPRSTGKDFGNYKKPKITVIKKLVPATDAGRFDLKVDGTTIKAAAGDGGTGSTSVTAGAHQVTETGGATAPTSPTTRPRSTARRPASARTYGPGWVHVKSGDDVVCTITNTRLGKVEIVKQTEPARDRRHRLRLHRLRGRLQPRRRRR